MRGMYGSGANVTSKDDCKDCSAGRFSEIEGLAYNGESFTCKFCPSGFFQDSGKTYCLPCSLGKFQNQEGQDKCEICLTGSFNDATQATACKHCSVGFNTPNNRNGASLCVPCIPGKYGMKDDDKATCRKCPAGWYRGDDDDDDTDAARCIQCPSGWDTNLKKQSTGCSSCAIGKYGSTPGTCTYCPGNQYQESAGKTSCEECAKGYNFVSKKTPCTPCDSGKFGNDTSGTCFKCTTGQYSSKKGSTQCQKCEIGKSPNEPQRTDCKRVEWKTVRDCDFDLQYLNNSDDNNLNWKCRPCPLGGFCKGDTAWQDVRALAGFWRVHDQSFTPPPCLLKDMSSTPNCAFVECLTTSACLGADDNDCGLNDPRKKCGANDNNVNDNSNNSTMLAISLSPSPSKNNITSFNVTTTSEQCNEMDGYANICFNSAGHQVRCRLCATCSPGWKRHGTGTTCKQCPTETANRAMLVIGVFVMLIGTVGLVVLTIRAGGGHDRASDAMKKSK
jgi:hypothetical protein